MFFMSLVGPVSFGSGSYSPLILGFGEGGGSFLDVPVHLLVSIMVLDSLLINKVW